MEIQKNAQQDYQLPPGLDPEAETLLAIAQDIGRECGLPNLEFYVSTALRQGDAHTRAKAAQDALDAMPLHNRSAAYREQIALEEALKRVLADVADMAGNGSGHWMDYARDLRCEGLGFAHFFPRYGPGWQIMNVLDRLRRGEGWGRGDTHRGERDSLYLDPKKIAASSRNTRGEVRTSKRAVEVWRRVTEEVGLAVLVRREAHGRKMHAPGWWKVDDPLAVLEEGLRRLVQLEKAGALPKGRNGSRRKDAPKAESDPVRTWCGPGADLDMPQHVDGEMRYEGIPSNTNTDNLGDCFRGGSTTQVSNTTTGGLLRGSGSNRAGSGSRLPPDTSLPPYVGALVSVLGEGRRSTVETTARVMIAAYGDEAVAPFFEEAARVKWTGVLEAVTWLKAQVSAAVARGDIPEAGILDPIPPAAAALKNRARG